MLLDLLDRPGRCSGRWPHDVIDSSRVNRFRALHARAREAEPSFGPRRRRFIFGELFLI
jgi:hypothetical protein